MQLVEQDLTKPERRLWEAVAAGEILDLSDVVDDDDRRIRGKLIAQLLIGGGPVDRPRRLALIGALVSGRLDLQAALLPCPLVLRRCEFDRPPVLEQAQAVFVDLEQCTLPGLSARQFRADADLQLTNVRSTGPVDLRGAHIKGTLWCTGMQVSAPKANALDARHLTVEQAMECTDLRAEGVVCLNDATVKGTLDVSGASVRHDTGPAVSAQRLTVAGDFFGRGLSSGGIDLNGALVTGMLDISGARLVAESAPALNGELLTVEQGVRGRGAHVEGRVILTAARIAGGLDFEGATLRQPRGIAFDGAQLQVEGGLFLRYGFDLQGMISLKDAHVKGALDLTEARLANPVGPATNDPSDTGGVALEGDLLRVDQWISCARLVTHGEVRLVGARVAGNFGAQGATLVTPEGVALNLARARLESDLLLSEGFSAEGVVEMKGAHVHGAATFTGARLVTHLTPAEQAAEGDVEVVALGAQLLRVDHELNLTDAVVEGMVELSDARVGGTLTCGGARLAQPGHVVLRLERAVVEGDVFLRNGFSATGVVNLGGAHIKGQLDLRGATVVETQATPDAVSAALLTVDQEILASDAVVEGGLDLSGAHITGKLDLDNATLLTDPRLAALKLEGATVDGPLLLRLAQPPIGGFDLSHAEVRSLVDSVEAWPAWLELDGFVYHRLPGDDEDSSLRRRRCQWLQRHRLAYSPHIYNQLAQVYRAAGHDQDAKVILMGKQMDKRNQADNGPVFGFLGRAWSFLLRVTIGYGLFPGRVLGWLAALLVVEAMVLARLFPQGFTARSAGPSQPEFNSVIFALDMVLPVANLDHREAWIAHGGALWWTTGFTLVGWLLATVVVAGLAGVFRRD